MWAQVIEVDAPVYDPDSPTGVSTGTVGYRQFAASEPQGGQHWGGGRGGLAGVRGRTGAG